VKIHAPPWLLLLLGSPIRAVQLELSAHASATLNPNPSGPPVGFQSLGVGSGSPGVQTPPERVNAHTAPATTLAELRSWSSPISAVQVESSWAHHRATLEPNFPAACWSGGVNFEPGCDQTPFVLVKTNAAPSSLLSVGAPISAVFPSAESATVYANSPAPVSPVPVSLTAWFANAPFDSLNTQAAPTCALSSGPPMMALVPSLDSDTLEPNSPVPNSSGGVSEVPAFAQVPDEFVNTDTVPASGPALLESIIGAPTNAVQGRFSGQATATLVPKPIQY
jgi:hypothetical protein